MSKKMVKKLLSLVVALTMIMGLSLTAFAADAYGDNTGIYGNSIDITYSITNQLPSSDLYTASAVPDVDNRECTYHYNIGSNDNVLEAIRATAKVLSPSSDITTTATNYGTAIDSIFTLPTVNNYGSNSWSGNYWKITLIGHVGNDTTTVYSFDAPGYPSAIKLGTAQNLNNIYGQSYTSLQNFMLDEIVVSYVYESMTW